jgi:hypothetical protein
MKMELEKLRRRLIEYRIYKQDKETSIHINALEIALNLTEFAIEKKYQISKEEQKWFNADMELIQILENSEWEDLLVGYFELKKYLANLNLLEI